MIQQLKDEQAQREQILQDYQHFCDLLWLEVAAWMDDPKNARALSNPPSVSPYQSFWRLQSWAIRHLGMLEIFNTQLMNGRHVTQSTKGFGKATAKLAMYAMMAYSRRRRDSANKVLARMKVGRSEKATA